MVISVNIRLDKGKLIDVAKKQSATKKQNPGKKRNRGRPKIKIDWEEFDKLCFFQCTLEEIANWFKCSVDTIENKCKEEKELIFSEYFKKASTGGRISLRRRQFQVADKGNVTMLIWLGKQHLGQRDNVIEKPGGDKSVTPVKVEIMVEDGRVKKDQS